jgi:leader peptidase (prepilin peptidase) / N-methyltransferase
LTSSAGLDLLLTPWALGLLGLLVGSFLNVVAHRMPLMLERQWWADVAGHLADAVSFERIFGRKPPAQVDQVAKALDGSLQALPALGIARPASRCPACGHRIRWYENIPVISWLALRAKCSACGVRISARYPFVELLTGTLFAAVAWRVGAQPAALMWCAVVGVLLALALIDWDTTVLPDALTLPLLWAGLLASVLGWSLPLSEAVWGAVAGYLSLWSVYWLFKLVTGKEGMGYGDFKLLAALGAWLSWQAILPIVLAASVLGAIVGIGLKATGGLREGRFVPFGPFLAGGGVAVLLIGLPTVLGWMGWR